MRAYVTSTQRDEGDPLWHPRVLRVVTQSGGPTLSAAECAAVRVGLEDAHAANLDEVVMSRHTLARMLATMTGDQGIAATNPDDGTWTASGPITRAEVRAGELWVAVAVSHPPIRAGAYEGPIWSGPECAEGLRDFSGLVGLLAQVANGRPVPL